MTAVAVIAKECRPGRVKTRLTPPFTPEQAAALAAAALDDTLDVVGALAVDRRVLYFDGDAVPAGAAGFDLLAQPPGELDERLAHLFDVMDEPTLLVGMDTPQLTPALVAAALDLDDRPAGRAVSGGPPAAPMREGPDGSPTPDAWLGPAADGGFWALAMRNPDGGVIRGVPMSRDDTGRRQLERLEAAGLIVGLLGELTDVDTASSAASVALAAPGTRFARLHRELAGGRP
ncbi:TIGR04282 family arsenosugar biosynthesis glycosyltransferase [Agromyces sp. GXS1127]|uniref:TIGR04282 family arsenosugar biosynthesis glycosyltransferase n=1 Tax=Agromyces sp. GXS1127 TaxID=3424181 RepID=UPI003D32220B